MKVSFLESLLCKMSRFAFLLLLLLVSCLLSSSSFSSLCLLLLTFTVFLQVRVFYPHGEVEKKLPVIVYYHGGGLCLGSHQNSVTDELVRPWVKNEGVIVVAVGYRLAPGEDSLLFSVFPSFSFHLTSSHFFFSYCQSSPSQPRLMTRWPPCCGFTRASTLSWKSTQISTRSSFSAILLGVTWSQSPLNMLLRVSP